MAKPRNPKKSQPSVKVSDLKPEKDPKGGVDKASPSLMNACATGKHIIKATI